MTNFLFWNIKGKPISDLVVSLVEEHSTDILMLAESEIDPGRLLRALNGQGFADFHFDPAPRGPVQLFTRTPVQFLRRIDDGSSYSIRELRMPDCIPVLLAVLHLPSRLFANEKSQDFECTVTARSVRDAEAKVGHDRTLVVGDFNMDPFSAGIVGAAGFNAAMHRKTANRGSRTIRGKSYPFFYNPMWNHFGDERKPAAGTYYYAKGDQLAYYWHMFDQVLVRPTLLNRLPVPGVRIATSAGDVSLLNRKGHPDAVAGSDHLPIVFSLNLEGAIE